LFISLHYFIQKLSVLYLNNNRIGNKGAKYLDQGLQTNRVRSLPSYWRPKHLFTPGSAFIYRFNVGSSLCSLENLRRIMKRKRNKKASLIWIEICQILVKNDVISRICSPVDIQFYYLIQTLTKLSLHHNQIDDQGAQYISEALKINTVK
jgi:hypothetical protein